MKYLKLGTDDAGLLPLLAPDPVLVEVDDPALAVAVLFLGGLNLLVPVEGLVGTELVVGGADAEAEADVCCKLRINMQ